MSSPNLRGVIATLACLLILVLVNLSIAGKEKLLAEGRVVYLQLAPVDPRSLMQGDYMALNYQVAGEAMSALRLQSDAGNRQAELETRDGRIVVSLDDHSVASFLRVDDGQALAPGEMLMRYRVRNGQLKFATNAFFFQEGTGGRYQEARYGMFRVSPDGELLLTHLCNKDLQQLDTQN